MPCRRTAALAVAVALGASAPVPAAAGGFYLTDRGVRPSSRGFAFVAGADDPGALWYNPAGIGWSGHQLLVDTTLTFMRASYTRIDSGGNVLPTVELEGAPLPIPTVAYTNDFGLESFTFGLGFMAPNSIAFDWPEHVTVDGVVEPAPQRYSLISMRGSAFAAFPAGVAFRPIPELSIGAEVMVIVGAFEALTALSACDRGICTQPENPDYDGLSFVEQGVLVELTGGAGITYDAGLLRFGFSFLLPFTLDGDAKIRVRLPEAALFDGASVDGDTVSLSLPFPFVLRAGVEVRPVEALRIELAGTLETWSRQRRMRITPRDVWIRGAHAIGDYEIGAIDIPREMKDTWDVRLGGRYTLLGGRLSVGGGMMFQTGAFDDAHLTALTLDTDKLVVGLGASFEATDGLWIDVSYNHLFLWDREVRNSRVPQPNPIRPSPSGSVGPPDGVVTIGNGDYAMEADMIGFGIRWEIAPPAIDRAESAATDEVDPSPEPPADDEAPRAPAGEPDPPAAPAIAPDPDAEASEPAPTEPGSPWYQRRRSRPR